ncbi:pilus assembly protein TadG-related protein [Nocardioides sp. BP30]|uniref:pilus assembly protein TadG-related protein n=1 Tax=Nocardioides sp. BP30 TaxID=3036374 RepID=UPI002469BBF0|nr:pilus assembly protein TadG-related protein [Nocardioides sp. BP30]WGL53716.1 pilus assembly protein TadG-related protein [Nocardioides sp. BP30]
MLAAAVALLARLADRHRWQERGAAALVLALVTAGVILPLGALAVDIGQQRINRGDLQAVADTAALDAARSMTSTSTDASVTASAKLSAGSDTGTVGSVTSVVAKVGYIDPSATWTSDQSLGCGGVYANAYFTYPAPSGKANAVLVVVHGETDFGLAGIVGVTRGGACRSAVSSASLGACAMMDSYAAQLATGNAAVLGPVLKILGTNLDAAALTSSGLVSTNLGVLDFLGVLQSRLDLGSVDQVLNAQVTAAQVIAAEVSALTRQGGTAAAAANTLATQIGVYATSTTPMRVGDLLGIGTGGTSALGASLNALDLAAAAVQLSNGTRPLTLGLSSSNLTGLSAAATVGSRPTPVCLGDGTRTMAQTAVGLSATLSGGLTGAVTNLANGLGSTLSGVLRALGGVVGSDTYGLPQITFPDPITASVSLAQATGRVTSLTCSGATPQAISVTEQSALAPSTITVPVTVTVKHTWGVLGSQSENLTTKLVLTISTASSTAQPVTGTLAVPGDYGKGVAGPSGNLSVNNLQLQPIVISGSDAKDSHGKYLVGDLLGGLASVTSTINNSLLTPLESAVVTPLLTAVTSALDSLIGATIAGSTYTPLPTPRCGTPRLND